MMCLNRLMRWALIQFGCLRPPSCSAQSWGLFYRSLCNFPVLQCSLIPCSTNLRRDLQVPGFHLSDVHLRTLQFHTSSFCICKRCLGFHEAVVITWVDYPWSTPTWLVGLLEAEWSWTPKQQARQVFEIQSWNTLAEQLHLCPMLLPALWSI